MVQSIEEILECAEEAMQNGDHDLAKQYVDEVRQHQLSQSERKQLTRLCQDLMQLRALQSTRYTGTDWSQYLTRGQF